MKQVPLGQEKVCVISQQRPQIAHIDESNKFNRFVKRSISAPKRVV